MARMRTTMLAYTLGLIAAALVASGGTNVSAQAKVIPGEQRTARATVEEVDTANRMITIRDDKGEVRTIKVPEQVKRLAEIKPGDTIRATFYDNIVLKVKAPGEPDIDTRNTAVTPGGGARPVGTSATQQTMTATVEAIDMNEPSIAFKGPRGWSYRTKVQNRDALKTVKVGDRVDITWTEATLVSVASSR